MRRTTKSKGENEDHERKREGRMLLRRTKEELGMKRMSWGEDKKRVQEMSRGERNSIKRSHGWWSGGRWCGKKRWGYTVVLLLLLLMVTMADSNLRKEKRRQNERILMQAKEKKTHHRLRSDLLSLSLCKRCFVYGWNHDGGRGCHIISILSSLSPHINVTLDQGIQAK